MKVIFFGSSSFSIPVLDALCTYGYLLVQVVTVPDRKKGRGQKLAPSLVKAYAINLGLPVISPERLKDPELGAKLAALAPDFVVVASYGKFLPRTLTKIARVAALNVHPSLLPLYRGASPIQYALLNGDSETGVSIAEVTEQLDAGDIFARQRTPIKDDEDAPALSDRLAKLGGSLLIETMKKFESKMIQRTEQDESKASYAAKLDKQAGKIDWRAPALRTHCQVRGLSPRPSAFTYYGEKRLKILRTAFLETEDRHEAPGTIVAIKKSEGIDVQTGKGCLRLLRMQLEGKKEMNAYEFSVGQRLKSGDRFSSS